LLYEGALMRLRAYPRDLKAHTILDTVSRHYMPFPVPVGRRGKFLKDDQFSKGVRDYLAQKYVLDQIRKREGRYEPRQIAKNFFR